MLNHYSDSDSAVKQAHLDVSESYARYAGSLGIVSKTKADKPPEPLAEFVRARLDELLRSGKTLKQIKLASGMDPKASNLNQIKDGATVTEYIGTKIAPALGYPDFPSLVMAAYAWWAGRAPDATPKAEGRAIDVATRFALSQGVSQAQIERAIANVPPHLRDAIDAVTWITRFANERQLDEAGSRAEQTPVPAAGAARAQVRHDSGARAIRTHGAKKAG